MLANKVAAWASDCSSQSLCPPPPRHRRHAIPLEVMNGLRDLGLWGLQVPPELGGLGLNNTGYAVRAPCTRVSVTLHVAHFLSHGIALRCVALRRAATGGGVRDGPIHRRHADGASVGEEGRRGRCVTAPAAWHNSLPTHIPATMQIGYKGIMLVGTPEQVRQHTASASCVLRAPLPITIHDRRSPSTCRNWHLASVWQPLRSPSPAPAAMPRACG